MKQSGTKAKKVNIKKVMYELFLWQKASKWYSTRDMNIAAFEYLYGADIYLAEPHNQYNSSNIVGSVIKVSSGNYVIISEIGIVRTEVDSIGKNNTIYGVILANGTKIDFDTLAQYEDVKTGKQMCQSMELIEFER